MGRPKRCAKRPSPYISYTPAEVTVTTTTINPADDPNPPENLNYIVIPQSGISCIRDIDPCPCGELFIPKGSGSNYVVIDNDYGSWGTYDSKTLVATLNSSSVDNYLHDEDVYIESGETFKTITSRSNGSGSFYLDSFVLQTIDGLNENGDGYEEHPFVFKNRIKVVLKSKEDNEVFAEKYFGSIGFTTSLNKLILNSQDFFKTINIISKTLILEIHSVCDFEVEKCIPDASVNLTTSTTTSTTSTSTSTTSTSTTSTSTTSTTTSTTSTSTTSTTTSTTSTSTTSTTTSTTSTSTTSTTTSTTTEQPPNIGDYEAGYYCFGGVECDPPSCGYHEGGPLYTYCNSVSGPYSTPEECDSNCTETTTPPTTNDPVSTTLPPGTTIIPQI